MKQQSPRPRQPISTTETNARQEVERNERKIEIQMFKFGATSSPRSKSRRHPNQRPRGVSLPPRDSASQWGRRRLFLFEFPPDPFRFGNRLAIVSSHRVLGLCQVQIGRRSTRLRTGTRADRKGDKFSSFLILFNYFTFTFLLSLNFVEYT